MTGALEWLRRQRRPKYATGGLITPGDAAPILTGGCTIPAPRPPADDVRITIRHDPPPLDPGQIQRLLRPGAHPDAPIDCPCRGIYSRCYCTNNRSTPDPERRTIEP